MGDLNNAQNEIDQDIVQTRNDVLRARDIYPPYNAAEPTDKPNTFPVPDIENNIEQQHQQKVESNDSPNFDLANQILENQRKAASSLRRGPGSKTNPQTEISDKPNQDLKVPAFIKEDVVTEPENENMFEVHEIDEPAEIESTSTHISTITKVKLNRTQESLIAEIVARDIDQFLKSA